VEFKISLIFPILVFVIYHSPVAACLLVLLGWLWGIGDLETIKYIPFFMMGALAAFKKEALLQWLPKLHWLIEIILLLLIFEARNLLKDKEHIYFFDCVGAMSSVFLILCAARQQTFFSHKSLVWLGVRAYPIYLLTFTTYFCLISLVPVPVPYLMKYLTCVVGSLLISLIISQLLHRYFEMPLAKFGRRYETAS